MNEFSVAYLMQKQSLPLEAKILYTGRRIQQFNDAFEDMTYVSFSGGLDSTVLLDIVRRIYPRTPAVFVDTGLEYPEIRDFVKTVPDVEWVKPKLSFRQILDKYGYPVVSKEQASFIQEYRDTKSDGLKKTRLEGNAWGRGKISEKWKFLLGAPFQISDKCCDYMKKEPAKRYEKETGRVPFVGTRADESTQRTQDYTRYGCNSFETKRPFSRPLSIWTHDDVWQYIRSRGLAYSKIYDMGYDRTGCAFCGFGCHLNTPNKFQIMAKTHPALHRYCMETLGFQEVFDYMKVPTI